MATATRRSAADPGRQRSFDDLGDPLIDVTFTVLDLETTGGSPAGSAITEIGAVKVRGGEVVGTFQTLVDPGVGIPPFITILTGITDAMVLAAPPIEAVLPAFLEFLGDTVVVGHNVSFDLGFLGAAAERLGYPPLANRVVDTLGLARRLVRPEVRNLKLATLAAHFRSPSPPTHRALDDARATVHVFHGLLERAGSIGVTALEDLLALPTARGGAHYEKIGLARALPREPGVYLFRDADGAVMYVGKAKNLRTRVSSYFYGDERRSVTAMLRELRGVDHIVCAGELEAAVVELRLIHEHRPRHNRASRPPRTSVWITLTDERFPRLALTRRAGSRSLLGPFRSVRAAEVVLAALWDAVPVRRCGRRPAGSGPCTAAQLGVALCPCRGDVHESRYAETVAALLAGVEDDPRLLLDPLVGRMEAYSAARRYEEAATVRDRHAALARAVESRRRWRALTAAGRIHARRDDGENAVVVGGALAASWREGTFPGAELPSPDDAAGSLLPPSVAAAEEAALIWRWLTAGGVATLDVEGTLSLPRRPVPTLVGSGRPARDERPRLAS